MIKGNLPVSISSLFSTDCQRLVEVFNDIYGPDGHKVLTMFDEVYCRPNNYDVFETLEAFTLDPYILSQIIELTCKHSEEDSAYAFEVLSKSVVAFEEYVRLYRD